jgi:hypothetical protein
MAEVAGRNDGDCCDKMKGQTFQTLPPHSSVAHLRGDYERSLTTRPWPRRPVNQSLAGIRFGHQNIFSILFWGAGTRSDGWPPSADPMRPERARRQTQIRDADPKQDWLSALDQLAGGLRPPRGANHTAPQDDSPREADVGSVSGHAPPVLFCPLSLPEAPSPAGSRHGLQYAPSVSAPCPPPRLSHSRPRRGGPRKRGALLVHPLPLALRPTQLYASTRPL